MRYRLALAALCLAASTSAQRLVAHDPFGGLMAETQPPDTIVPAPNPPFPVYPTVPVLPPPPAVAAGDATSNTITGITWFTNGMVLASMPSPSFPPAGPVLPPFPIAPPVLALLGGPVSGIALDPVAGILWLTSGGPIVGVAPVPGTPVVVPPFALAFPTGILAGLEWDGLTGTLLAVDIGAVTYTFFPGGAMAAPPIVPPMVLPAPIGDVAIDKSGVANPAGVRSIWITGGPLYVDVMLAMGPIPTGVGPGSGLAYLPRPASAPPLGACPCGPLFVPAWGTTGPMTAGNGAFALTLGGLPPGQIALFAFDFAFNPAFPMINGVGCPLGLVIGSATMAVGAAFANPAGVAISPFGLPPIPGLGPIYEQTFTLCPADPAGFVLAPMLQLAAGGT